MCAKKSFYVSVHFWFFTDDFSDFFLKYWVLELKQLPDRIPILAFRLERYSMRIFFANIIVTLLFILINTSPPLIFEMLPKNESVNVYHMFPDFFGTK